MIVGRRVVVVSGRKNHSGICLPAKRIAAVSAAGVQSEAKASQESRPFW
ncbi:hypothetical protein ACQ86F_10585 [Streptomyces venezuelae ATCC 10712]